MKLRHLDEDNAMRKQNARYYIEHIKHPDIALPKVDNWDRHVFHIFPIRTTRRDELQKYLAEKSIQINIHYPIPPHKQECYKEWNSLSMPVTEKIHGEELSLPMSPVMTKDELSRVTEVINSWR